MLTLVVIAQRKTALVGQRQMTGELVHGIEYFANQFLKPLGKARPIKFFQMRILQAQQGGEHRHWCAGSRAVIAVADGGVQPGAGFFLDFFQHRKEPPQPVGRVRVAEVSMGKNSFSSKCGGAERLARRICRLRQALIAAALAYGTFCACAPCWVFLACSARQRPSAAFSHIAG